MRSALTVARIARLLILRPLAVLLVIFALALMLQGIWLPSLVESYRTDLADEISHKLNLPVKLQDLKIVWGKGGPALRLEGLSLDDPTSGREIATFDWAQITLDIVRSVSTRHLALGAVHLQGKVLTLEHDARYGLRLMPQSNEQRGSVSLGELIGWMYEVGPLSIAFDSLLLRPPDAAKNIKSQELGALSLEMDPGTQHRRVRVTLAPGKVSGQPVEATLKLRHHPEETGDDIVLYGHVNGLRLQELVSFASPWLTQSQRLLLRNLSPRGHLSRLAFHLTLAEAPDGSQQLRSPSVAGRFHAVTHQAWQKIPGVAGLDGSFILERDGGRLELNGRDIQLETSTWLRAPVILETLDGVMRWQWLENGRLRLEAKKMILSNSALHSRLRGHLTLCPHRGDPILDLTADFSDLQISKIKRYLPARLMKPKLVDWLDRALVDGQVSRGRLKLEGHLADFPFDNDNGAGVFETHLRFENALIDYFPGWPPIEDAIGGLSFRKRGMDVEVEGGRIFGTQLERVSARMKDLTNGPLRIRGRTKSAGATMLEFLREGPLAGKTAEFVKGLEISGDNTLDLALTIPFRGRPIKVEGGVVFEDTDLDLGNWGTTLRRVRGRLGFTRTTLNADGILLRLADQPMRLDVDTVQGDTERRDTRFRLKGRVDIDELLKHYSILSDTATLPLTGESEWEMLVTIPNRSGNVGKPTMKLRSSLKGTAITLPAPLGKAADERRDLEIRVDPGRGGDGATTVELDYAPETRAVLAFAAGDGTPRFERGELRISAGIPVLPIEEGLRIIAELPRFEVEAPSSSGMNIGALTRLTSLDVYTEELVAAGQRFPRTRVQSVHRDGTLALQLSGETLAGRLMIPLTSSRSIPLRVHLTRLALSAPKANALVEPSHQPKWEDRRVWQETDSAPDPRRLPPLSILIEELRLNDRHLGRLRLDTTPITQGMRLDRMELSGDHARVIGQGEWWMANRQHRSRIKLDLHSEDPAAAARQLGYEPALQGGAAHVELTASWPGPLTGYMPGLLSGRLRLDIGPGRLLGIEPGLGRVVGLANLSAFKRRLQLDFSDLFDRGLTFDNVKGSFTIRKGQIYTDDLQLESPAVGVDFKGRIGLEARDLEQIITITPRVSISLPIAGALVGGPVVGAIALLAERVFQDDIDKVGSYQYRLTGTWDDPTIELIRSAPRLPNNSAPIQDLR